MRRLLLVGLLSLVVMPVLAWPNWSGGVSGTTVSGTHPQPTAQQRAAMQQRMQANKAAMQQRMQAHKTAMQPCSDALHAAKTPDQMTAARKTCQSIGKTLQQQDAAQRH